MSDLAELGLSSYEERAYRALLSLGPSPARTVAEAAEVPRGRIYDVLNALAARDLVWRRDGDPTRYAAVDPETAADRLLAERRSELERERDRYERLADRIGEDLAPTVPSEGRFWPLDLGSEVAVEATRRQYDRVEETLLSVVGPPYDGAPIERYADEIDVYVDLVTAGVTVQLLTTPALIEASSDRLAAVLGRAEAVAVRTTPAINLTFDVLDGEAVYLGVPAPFTDGAALGALAVRDEDCVRQLTERFHEAWERATPVDPEDL